LTTQMVIIAFVLSSQPVSSEWTGTMEFSPHHMLGYSATNFSVTFHNLGNRPIEIQKVNMTVIFDWETYHEFFDPNQRYLIFLGNFTVGVGENHTFMKHVNTPNYSPALYAVRITVTARYSGETNYTIRVFPGSVTIDPPPPSFRVYDFLILSMYIFVPVYAIEFLYLEHLRKRDWDEIEKAIYQKDAKRTKLKWIPFLWEARSQWWKKYLLMSFIALLICVTIAYYLSLP